MSRVLVTLRAASMLMFAAHTPQEQQPYVLKVHTDEVALTFHAEDTSGLPVSDLAAADMRVLDNGHPPSRITLFNHHAALPIHIAIVFDTTPSMGMAEPPAAVVNDASSTAIHDPRDRALVMFFDFEPTLQQDWTNDPKLLVKAASRAYGATQSRFGGTAVWDSLYRICRDNITSQVPGEESFASAIMLFTDGQDNRSHALPEDVVEECQSRQTAIYPFVGRLREPSKWKGSGKQLSNVAELTGGRMLLGNSKASIVASIHRIEEDLRDRYTLVYRPADFKRDDRFHTVKLETINRNATIDVRKGYYAAR